MELKQREIYAKARISKDNNFDGRFFFAVKTTGIFCRPSCPAPVAKEENVEYFENIFKPLERGYRPCHRCRPDITIEYSKSFIPGSDIVEKALNLIYSGFLSYKTVDELAAEVGISPRQMRKLFIDCIGIPPVKVGRYHKAVFAKKLLLSSVQSITEIAFASGFRSTRQFNAAYSEIFGETPRNTRRQRSGTTGHGAVLFLKYKPPLNFGQMLNFMQTRLITGVEKIVAGSYYRTFRTQHAGGWFSVADIPEKGELQLEIHSDDVRCYMEIYSRVRMMFDLDVDISAVSAVLGKDPLLRRGMTEDLCPRLPAAFDSFEFVIRAILGQQITVKAATTLAGRIASAVGSEIEAPDGLQYFFPTPDELAAADISSIGITKTRQQTIRTVTEAVIDGRLNLSATRSFDAFAQEFSALKGIGDWTVNYTAMRGLGMKDAFPAADLGIIKAMTPTGGKKPTVKQIEAEAERWRPYRSYAALCMWNIPAGSETKE